MRGGGRETTRAQTENFALIRFEDFEAIAGEIDLVAWGRDLAERVTKQTRHGGYGSLGVIAELHSEEFFRVRDRHAAAQDQTAIRLADGIRRRLNSLRAALSDNFFDQIFDRGDARDGTVLIDDHDHGLAFLAHLLEQVGADFGLRHKKDGLKQVPYLTFGQIGVGDLQQVL